MIRRGVAAFAVLLIMFALLPGLLRIGGVQVTAVNGHSMRQAVPDHSIVVTRPVSGDSLRTGDVVVFSARWLDGTAGATSVVHRLSLITSAQAGSVGYTTGDANVVTDPLPVNLSMNQALVIGVIPLAGIVCRTPWLALIGFVV